jgi:hypothetical protein
MRNASRFLAILGVAAVVIAVVTPASANCIPAKLASTFNEQGYVYIDMGPGVTNNQVAGGWWAAGSPTNNNGTYGANEWLFVDLGGKLSMQANLGDARVNGCPAGKLVVRLSTTTANPRFLTLTAVEGAAGSTSAFDFQFGRPTASIIPSAPLPRPHVVTSGRAGGVVNLNLSLDSTAAGNQGDSAGAVTGYDIVRAAGSDPGRGAAGWTFVQTVGAAGGGAVPSVPLTADCSNPSQDQFFATRLNFADGQKSDTVSDAFRVNCNPALAEPRFNVVPKKPTGPKKNGTRQ